MLLVVVLFCACTKTINNNTYKLIPAKGTTPAICMEYTDVLKVIESEHSDHKKTEILDGTCLMHVGPFQVPAKTELLCSKEPKQVPLSFCGIYPVGSDIRGLKKDGDMTVCYSKTFQTILPWGYCLPDTEVNVNTQVSQISVQSVKY